MKQAFVSYSRKDKVAATHLTDDLAFRGLAVWIDLRDIPPGTQWSEQIEQAIQDCPFFLLLLSPQSIASEYVQREYRYALQLGRTIIPVLLQPCAIPDEIAHIQYVDFSDYRSGLHKLLRVFPAEAFDKGQSIADLQAFLKSPNTDVRRSALNAVAHAPLHELVDQVIELAGDENSEVRVRVAYALDKISDSKSIPTLIQMLHDPVYDVRSTAGWALVHLGEMASPAVRAALSESRNADAREMALLVLKYIGS